MLKIKITPEHEQPITRTLPGKDGKQARTIREQIGYAYLGGKLPVEMKLSLQDDQSAYKSGNYELDSSSFTVNNFGGLELKRFGIKLVRSMK